MATKRKVLVKKKLQLFSHLAIVGTKVVFLSDNAKNTNTLCMTVITSQEADSVAS
jgi:hypothetical protein